MAGHVGERLLREADYFLFHLRCKVALPFAAQPHLDRVLALPAVEVGSQRLLQSARLERHRAQLDKISGAAHHLLSIINDLLDLSKIEAGRLVLEAADFDLESVVASACDLVTDAAAAKGLTLTVDLAGLPAAVNPMLLGLTSR